MSTINPYATPDSRVQDSPNHEYGAVRIFGVKGRLGRARYLAYMVSLLLIFWLGGSVLTGVATAATAMISKQATMVVMIGMMIVIYGTMIVISTLFSIQRVHDFDSSGWLVLLMYVPIINIIFGIMLWFIPGTDGENRFGQKTPPNGTGVIILASLMPILIVAYIGMMAAIAIPAYKGYMKKAQEHRQIMEQNRQSAPAK